MLRDRISLEIPSDGELQVGSPDHSSLGIQSSNDDDEDNVTVILSSQESVCDIVIG